MIQPFLLNDITNYPNAAGLLANCPLHLVKEIDLIKVSQAGEFHLPQGHYHNYVYLLLEGQCEISITESSSNRSTMLTVYSQEGTLIGEQEAILDRPYSASVVNTTPCKLLRISTKNFKQWIQLDQVFTLQLLTNQCQQVYDLSHQTAYFTLHTAKEQIALYLFQQFEKKLIINKQDVHRAVATSSRNANRILSDLQHKGIIAIKQSSIQVLQAEKLLYYGEE